MGQYTLFRKRQPAAAREARVYADLDHLVRLRAKSSGFSFLPRQPVHSILAGRYASRLRGRGLNFEELRAYLPGDDTRTIDWRVTARTSEPHVRVYTEEKDRPVWLLVDQRLSMFFASQGKMKSVIAAEAAAVAAWRSLSQGDRCGAVIFDDSGLELFQPQRSETAVIRMLEAVVRKNQALRADSETKPGVGMLNEALARVAALAKHDNLVCLITDGTGLDEESRRHVTRVCAHNDVLATLVFDPMEAELPDSGTLDFTDGQSEWQIDSSRQNLRNDYQQDFQQRLERLRQVSRKHSIPLMPISTDKPVLDQIRRLLGNR